MKENIIVEKDLQIFLGVFPFTNEIKGSTFLVTGATGLIGSMFIKCLLRLNEVKNAGVTIIAIARDSKKALRIFGDSEVCWIYQDMQDSLCLKDYAIDYIVHCASSTSSRFYVEHPVETINTAYLGTNSLLYYATERDVKGMVYLSSLESYGTVLEDHEMREEDTGIIIPTDVRSSYSLGKRAVECLCHCYAKEYGVHVRMARLTQTFGAGVSLEDSRVFAQFAKSIIKGENIIMHTKGESAKPYCYTIDAIMGIFYLLLKGQDGEAYNIANSSTYISIHDMAIFLANTFGSSTKVVVEEKDNMGYAPITKLRLNTEKLESLGWKPIYNLRDMYHHLIDYYKTSI